MYGEGILGSSMKLEFAEFDDVAKAKGRSEYKSFDRPPTEDDELGSKPMTKTKPLTVGEYQQQWRASDPVAYLVWQRTDRMPQLQLETTRRRSFL